MRRESFQIDTNGSCLFCLRDCHDGIRTSRPSSAFKMLLRYLKIDIMKLAKNFPSSSLRYSEYLDISVTLCAQCSLATEQFLQLFQDYERIRMELDGCAGKLCETIRGSEEEENGTKKSVRKRQRRGLQDDDTSTYRDEGVQTISLLADAVRKETLETCSRRLKMTTPRIVLNDARDEHDEFSNLEHFKPNISEWNLPLAVHIKEENMGVAESENDSFWEAEAESISFVPKAEPEDFETPMFSLLSPPENSDDDSSSSCTSEASSFSRKRKRGRRNSSSDTFEQCAHCNKSFRTSYLIKHLSSNHTLLHFSNQLPANTTEKQLASAIKSVLAKKSAISKETIKGQCFRFFKCPQCPRKFRGDKLRMHVLQSHFDQVVTNLQDLEVVEESHNEDEEDIILPENENGERVTEVPTSAHHRLILPTGEVKCLICEKVYAGDKIFRKHYKIKHAGIFFKCIHCSQRFTTRPNLRLHLATSHPLQTFSNHIPSQLTEEDLQTAVKVLLTSNKSGPTSSAKTPSECNFCEKVCHNSHLMKAHLFQSHLNQVINKVKRKRGKKKLGIKAIINMPPATGECKCSHCGGTFSNVQSMLKHQKMFHSGETFQCAYCEEQFSFEKQRQCHVAREHVSQIFQENFPAGSGTTEDEFRKTVDMYVDMIKLTEKKKGFLMKVTYKCLLCTKIFAKTYNRRVHIFHRHMNEIVATLKNVKHEADKE